MFTGIIEQLGVVKAIKKIGTNITLTIEAELAKELKIDQSLSHNGACLTIESINGNQYEVTAIAETILKTTIGYWEVGTKVNLERCISFNGRIDGHFVQGHVDTIGTCVDYKEKDGSWEYTIEFDKKFKNLIIEKGSISLNGISLTIFNITENTFTVAIIPYTYNHTNMHSLKLGDKVNLEFDMVGKYVGRIKGLQ
jgi:riboflavin synthase